MITIVKSIVLAALAVAVTACLAQEPGIIEGKVIGISDGDTLTVLGPDKTRIRVRLAEIDAPESSQAFGNRAKQALSSICFGRMARISTTSLDQYDRVVSRVSCEGVDAQSYMVGNGLAWVYERYAKDRALYNLQDQARDHRTGLWGDPNPVAPWSYRRENRK